MNPKRRRDLTKFYSEQSGIPEETIDLIVRGYYSEIQKMMSECEHSAIRVPELGVFHALDYRIERKLERLSNIIEKTDPAKSMRNYAIAAELTQNMSKIKKLKVEVDKEKERRKEIREKRYDKNNQSFLESDI